MTTRRVWSGSASDGPGTSTDWSDAYHTIDGARSGASLGSSDIIMVHSGTTPHSEISSTANIDITGPTSGAPLTIICVDKDNSDSYLIATTDILATTTGAYDILFDGSFALYGLWCDSNDDFFTSDTNEFFYAKDCKFTLPGTIGEDFHLPSIGCMQNCTFELGSSSVISCGDKHATLINPIITGTRANGVIDAISSITNINIIGADFTGLNTKVFDYGGAVCSANFIGCVSHATHDIVDVELVRTCVNFSGTDTVAGNNQWREEKEQGSQSGFLSLSDSIYRDGAATYDGTNEYSFCYEPGSVQHIDAPTYTDWNTIYVAAADGKNIKVYIASTASQDDAEVWLEVEYFSSISNTLKKVASSRIETILDTPAANATSTGESWTGITESPANGQFLTLPSTIDIKKSGMLRWRVGFASADTVYFCPKPEII